VKLSLRELRGLGIVAMGGQIQRFNDATYIVKSQGSGSNYKVEWAEDRWICNCHDYLKRGKPCKHIYAVNFRVRDSFLASLPKTTQSNVDVILSIIEGCIEKGSWEGYVKST